MERGLVLGEGSQAAELVVIFFFFLFGTSGRMEKIVEGNG